MNKHYLGLLGAVGTLVAGLTGCGSQFNDNCAETRTCGSPNDGEGGGADSGGADSGDGGAADTSAAGSGVTSPGGTDSSGAGAVNELGGAGGGAAATGCHSPVDCSNGNPDDGEELCDATGACLPGNPPPSVVSVTPNDAAMLVETGASIVIAFSEPLDAASVTAANVKLSLGAKGVSGTVSYADSKITFKPASPLALLGNYSVTVGVGVKDPAGAALLEPFSSQFEVRDGAWKVIDGVKDRVGGVSPSLALSDAGETQLVWAGAAGALCPVTARRFYAGAPVAPAKTFPVVEGECESFTSAGNQAGATAVAWTEHDNVAGSFIAQFRDTAWSATTPRISDAADETSLSLAVSPDGKVTFFAHASHSSKAWRTDADGTWQAKGDTLGTFTAHGRTSVAFDADGNGLAVWRAVDDAAGGYERIVGSRYSKATGKWGAAVDLPESVATAAAGQRGVPSVVLNPNGEGLVLWVASGKLKASHYKEANGWSVADTVSGSLDVAIQGDAPAVAYDGAAFVAAWTAKDSGSVYTYTARYDSTGWSVYQAQQQSAADGNSAARMPRLTSDGRGNSLLVWAKGTSPSYTLVYQRFADQAWSAIKAVPGGTVTAKDFENDDRLPMAGNPAGQAVLAWANKTDLNFVTSISLASFF